MYACTCMQQSKLTKMGQKQGDEDEEVGEEIREEGEKLVFLF